VKNPVTSIKKTRIEKSGENKMSIIVGSLLLIAVVSAIILGIMFPATIPYSLEILRWTALIMLAVIAWRDVFHAMDIEESKQYQRSL
jgi:membrane protein implicated in regulation of membrane protease activity